MNPQKFLHSHNCTAIVGTLATLVIWCLAPTGKVAYPVGNGGIVASWSLPWMVDSPIAPVIGILLTMLIAVLLTYINSKFNLLRSPTHLQATAWIVIIMAAPALAVNFCQPMVSAPVVLLCVYVIFSTYADKTSMQEVFLIFVVLSVCSGFDVVFVGLIPVFLLGCAQMRIFSLRTVLAMLMGLATPWIILICFGIVPLDQFVWPQIPARIATVSEEWVLPLILATSLTAFVCLAAWVQNLIKYLTYNAHSRAMLSVVTVLSFVSIIFVILNFTKPYASLPLLAVCAALQLGHLFGVVHTRPKSYIAIICFLFPFILISLWTILLCIL